MTYLINLKMLFNYPSHSDFINLFFFFFFFFDAFYTFGTLKNTTVCNLFRFFKVFTFSLKLLFNFLGSNHTQNKLVFISMGILEYITFF